MSTRLRLFVMFIGALLVVITYTYPTWQPFLQRESSQEGFPDLAENLQPAYQELPAADRRLYLQMNEENALMAVSILTAALNPDEALPDDAQALPDVSTAQLMREGEFALLNMDELELDNEDDISPYLPLFKSEGSVIFYQYQDGRKLLRLENFRVTNGLNLHVYLSPNPTPITFADLGFYYDAGQLQANTGSQTYEIPSSLNLDEYQSIVIVCLSYQFIYGIADF
ncbi:MAG: DM13 domain-containing protein [Chitinophagaceae bacterium]|nr:DM13 domain-containing protein [Anaerolineae bacterium]